MLVSHSARPLLGALVLRRTFAAHDPYGSALPCRAALRRCGQSLRATAPANSIDLPCTEQMSAQHPIAPDSYRLERAGRVLHAGTAEGFPNLTKPELRELAATAREVAAIFDAEIEARSAPFPASLPPALVMQWLRLREVPAALRVARSWRDESEQYFRRFAQHHGLIRGGDSWQDSVRCCMEWCRYEWAKRLQKYLFKYYAKQWANYDYRFIPIDDLVVAAHGSAYFRGPFAERTVRRVRRSIVSLVCFGKLIASPTGGGHRFNFQAVEGLDDLPPFHLHVLTYYAEHATSDVGLAMNAVAASLGVDPSRVRAAVHFLESKGYLYSTIDDDHHKYTVYYPT